MIEEQLFHQALEQPEDQRASFLDAACKGDADLRERVQVLLRAHAHPGSFLESPPRGAAPTIDHPFLELPGTQIGPYKLLEQIGEGGMGVVYHASQREPVRRTVALKIIKPGMDSREVVKRFEAERQALAMMDHPNIAKVFDGGATDAGRPYFVMELIKRGKPITEYCDREQLSMRARLELFVTLCHGVQHAHQKGVIHRDLKPSNVLVEVHDVRPVPKIIDFGIAKAMGQQLSEQSLHTAFDQMVGTPLYMSPEQAGQSTVDVDTRSDIYSLGVVLYELLTGHTPFERDTLRTVGVDEMRRIIRDVNPPRPSARVSTLQAADLSTISERRHIESGKLSQQLRGDLDWIVMKAMDKDPDRRYATANDLASDVERYLHDDPVQACPPSAAYRFTKFARRNRAALVTSGLVALALIAGTGVSVWQALRATNAEQRIAKTLRTAEDRLQFGLQVVDEMYVQVAEKWLSQQAEMTPLQKQFLEKALAFYQRLATEDSTDPAVLSELAKREQRVGAIQRRLGRRTEAATAYRHAVAIFESLLTSSPDDRDRRSNLAVAQFDLTLVIDMEQPVETEALLRGVISTVTALLADDPKNAEYRAILAAAHNGLGLVCKWLGRLRETETSYRQALSIYKELAADFPQDPRYRLHLAKVLDNLVTILRKAGKADEWKQFDRQATEIMEQLGAEYPEEPEYQSRIADDRTNRAYDLMEEGKLEEARNLLEQAIAQKQTALKSEPDNPKYPEGLAVALDNLGDVLYRMGRLDESETALRSALEIEERVNAKTPLVLREELRRTACNLAQVLENLGKLAEAEVVCRRSLEVSNKIVADASATPQDRMHLTRTSDDLARLYQQMKKLSEAEQAGRRAVEIQNALAADRPDDVEVRQWAGAYLSNLAETLRDLGQLTEARQLLEQAVMHQQAALKLDPGNVLSKKFLDIHLQNLTELQTLLDEGKPAPEPAAKVEEVQELPKSTPAPEPPKAEEKPQ